jgi:hypothetical protein
VVSARTELWKPKQVIALIDHAIASAAVITIAQGVYFEKKKRKQKIITAGFIVASRRCFLELGVSEHNFQVHGQLITTNCTAISRLGARGP